MVQQIFSTARGVLQAFVETGSARGSLIVSFVRADSAECRYAVNIETNMHKKLLTATLLAATLAVAGCATEGDSKVAKGARTFAFTDPAATVTIRVENPDRIVVDTTEGGRVVESYRLTRT